MLGPYRLFMQMTHAQKTAILTVFGILALLLLLVYMDDAQYKYNRLHDPRVSLQNVLQDALTTMGRHGNEDCEHRLPDCIVIGAMETGIKTFTSFLGLHPQAAVEFGDSSEDFFSSNSKFYGRGLDWYRHRMTCSTRDQLTIAKSPHYFSSFIAQQRIFDMNPDIKIIIVVRDPIERALSHFLKEHSAKPSLEDIQMFESSVYNSTSSSIHADNPYVAESTYIIQLKRWLQYFPLKQILILNDYTADTSPIPSLKKAEKFLGINRIFSEKRLYFDKENGIYCLKRNSTLSNDLQRSCLSTDNEEIILPTIEEEVYLALKQYFSPYNDMLKILTDVEVDW